MPYSAVTFQRRDNGTFPVTAEAVNAVQQAVEALSAEMVAANAALGQPAYQTIAYASSIAVNAALGEVVKVGTLTGDITVGAPSNAVAGQHLVFIFTQNGTGGHTVSWNAVYVNEPTLAETANLVQVVEFVYDGTNWIFVGHS